MLSSRWLDMRGSSMSRSSWLENRPDGGERFERPGLIVYRVEDEGGAGRLVLVSVAASAASNVTLVSPSTRERATAMAAVSWS